MRVIMIAWAGPFFAASYESGALTLFHDPAGNFALISFAGFISVAAAAFALRRRISNLAIVFLLVNALVTAMYGTLTVYSVLRGLA